MHLIRTAIKRQVKKKNNVTCAPMQVQRREQSRYHDALW